MKFSLISDMHVDFPQEKTPYDKLEKKVVVAGDTSNGLHGLKFLNKMQRKGFDVYACTGNHEHYSNRSQDRDYIETEQRFTKEFPSRGVLFDDVPIILINGWYRVSNELKWQLRMNDSRNTALSADRMNQIAFNNASFIEEELEIWSKVGVCGVVVTHTAPCEETLDPRFEGDPSNEWYWNPYMRDLLSEYSDVIRVWCHGHTHAKNEAVVDGVRVVCNPRGYPGENPSWEPLTINVE